MSNRSESAETAKRRTRNLWSLLWGPFVWAVPFAIFFGTLSGASWTSYRIAYLVSLVFSVTIRTLIYAVERFLLPVLRFEAPAGRYPLLREGLLFMGASLTGSYLAAFVVDRFVLHGFLGGSGGLLRTGLFAAAFSITIGGLIYATVFYRTSVARAVALERVRGELARAELRALRAQINPHFLFNTLNTIAALIAENPAAAEDIVTRLADVFRYALTSADREHARLEDELAFMRAYLAIEHARLGDRLRVIEDIEPGLDDLCVPSLLFQPIVENAVRYAVAPRIEGGTVRLSARRIESPGGPSLVVEVADDGPGIRDGARPQGHGVGLESVRERLRIAGADHALTIESAPGRGTVVRVLLPIRPSTDPAPGAVPPEEPPCERN